MTGGTRRGKLTGERRSAGQSPGVRRPLASLLLLVAASVGAAAAPPAALTRALLDGDAPAARAAWDALGEADREALRPYGGDLVPARIFALEGKDPEAREILAKLGLDVALRDVAAYDLWRLASAAGDEPRELAALDLLVSVAQGHPSLESWMLRRSILAARHGRMGHADAELATLASGAKEKRVRRDARSWQIEILLAKGTNEAYAAALPMVKALLKEGSQDDAALRAVRAITSHEELRGVAVDSAAAYLRGETFYQAREWPSAILHLARAAGLEGVGPDGFPAPGEGAPSTVQAGDASAVRAEAAFLVGRVFYRMGDFDDAVRAYELAASMDEGIASSARSQRIVCLLRGGNADRALAAIDEAPGKPTARLHELRAGALWSLGRHDEARAALAEARSMTRDAEGRREIDAREARILLDAAERRGEAEPARVAMAEDALRVLASGTGSQAGWARLVLAGRRRDARPSDTRELYGAAIEGDRRGVWGEVARLELGDMGCDAREPVVAGVEEAAALLLSDPAGDADPAVIAKERLLELGQRCPDVVERDGLDELQRAYLRFGRYREGIDVAPISLGAVGASSARHLRLLALGLASEASFSLLADPAGGREDPMKRAIVLAMGGETKRSLYLAEVRLSRTPSDLVMAATSPVLRTLLYPMPEGVRAAADAAGIDPRLVAAIAREESRFAPDARSPAGARGIMQLVVDTARSVAAPGELEDAELYVPERSLGLGARYLKQLEERFGGSVPATIAAYNGGPEAVGEWSARAGTGLLELHPEVEYSETQSYLAKVYLSYLRYRALYPDGTRTPAWGALVLLPEPAA